MNSTQLISYLIFTQSTYEAAIQIRLLKKWDYFVWVKNGILFFESDSKVQRNFFAKAQDNNLLQFSDQFSLLFIQPFFQEKAEETLDFVLSILGRLESEKYSLALKEVLALIHR